MGQWFHDTQMRNIPIVNDNIWWICANIVERELISRISLVYWLPRYNFYDFGVPSKNMTGSQKIVISSTRGIKCIGEHRLSNLKGFVPKMNAWQAVLSLL